MHPARSAAEEHGNPNPGIGGRDEAVILTREEARAILPVVFEDEHMACVVKVRQFASDLGRCSSLHYFYCLSTPGLLRIAFAAARDAQPRERYGHRPGPLALCPQPDSDPWSPKEALSCEENPEEQGTGCCG